MRNGYIYIENDIFPTLFAISEDEQSNGLMHEPFPPPIMSFVYAEPKYNKFWMKNTPSPLDIVFCNNGRIKEICYGEPLSTKIVGNCMSDLVIEFPYGTVDRLKIQSGYKVGIVEPFPAAVKTLLAQKNARRGL